MTVVIRERGAEAMFVHGISCSVQLRRLAYAILSHDKVARQNLGGKIAGVTSL